MILMFGLEPPKDRKIIDYLYPEVDKGRPLPETELVTLAGNLFEHGVASLTVWTESTVFLMACRAAKKANPTKYLVISFQVNGEVQHEVVDEDGRMNRDVPSVMDDLLSKLL